MGIAVRFVIWALDSLERSTRPIYAGRKPLTRKRPSRREGSALQVENDLSGAVLKRRIMRRATLNLAALLGVGQQLPDVNRWRERHSNLLLAPLKVPEGNALAEHAGVKGLGPSDEP